MQLVSGLKLENPEDLLEAFIQKEYEAYDGIIVKNDLFLRPEEIAISIMVNSQISGNTARAIWENRGSVETCLANIGCEATILDDYDAIPWSYVENAIDEICKVKRAKLAVATKILHKKRPALIPIIDSVIAASYHPHIPKERGRSWGGYGGRVMKAFRTDILSVRDEVEMMRRKCLEIGKPLTSCRILEILIWATIEPIGYYKTIIEG